MPSGKAHGADRDYQVLARDILITLRDKGNLSPYAGDGIDVPFELGGTTWFIDVALVGVDRRIVVAECRRWRDPIKQEHIAAFAYRVESLRKDTGAEAALYFTKSKYQIGAIKAAVGRRRRSRHM